MYFIKGVTPGGVNGAGEAVAFPPQMTKSLARSVCVCVCVCVCVEVVRKGDKRAESEKSASLHVLKPLTKIQPSLACHVLLLPLLPLPPTHAFENALLLLLHAFLTLSSMHVLLLSFIDFFKLSVSVVTAEVFRHKHASPVNKPGVLLQCACIVLFTTFFHLSLIQFAAVVWWQGICFKSSVYMGEGGGGGEGGDPHFTHGFGLVT